MTLITAGFGLGSELAGPISVQVTEHLGWQSVFVFGGAASMLISVLLLACLPESLLYMHRMGWGPLLLESIGFSRTSAADISSINGLAGTVGSLLLMRFTDRHGAPASR